MKEQPIVKPEASRVQHPKYHHNDMSEIILGVCSFNNHQLTWLEWYPDL